MALSSATLLNATWSRIRLTAASHCRLSPERASMPAHTHCRPVGTRAHGIHR